VPESLDVVAGDHPSPGNQVHEFVIADVGRDIAFGEPGHLAESPVAQQQPPGIVEHQEALRHVVQRRLETLRLDLERVRGPLPFPHQRQRRMRPRLRRAQLQQPLMRAQVANAHERRRGDDELQCQRDGADRAQLAVPAGQHRVHRLGHDDQQRIVGQGKRGDQPIPGIDQSRGPMRHARLGRRRPPEGLGRADIPAEFGVHGRNVGQQRAVPPIQCERSRSRPRHTLVQVLELPRFQRDDHDADEFALGVAEGTADMEPPGAGPRVQRGCADEQTRRAGDELRMHEIPPRLVGPPCWRDLAAAEPLPAPVEQHKTPRLSQIADPVGEFLAHRRQARLAHQGLRRVHPAALQGGDQPQLDPFRRPHLEIGLLREDDAPFGKAAPGLRDVPLLESEQQQDGTRGDGEAREQAAYGQHMGAAHRGRSGQQGGKATAHRRRARPGGLQCWPKQLP
jgi:hypothetical protein